jgi:hypothetical protein
VDRIRSGRHSAALFHESDDQLRRQTWATSAYLKSHRERVRSGLHR